MSRALRWLFIVPAILIGLLLLLAVLAITLVDPNAYKNELSQLVYDQSGHRLNIEGDISLHFLPWLGLSVGKVSVAGSPGISDKPLAQVRETGLRVAPWPLLRGRVQVDTVYVDGLTLNLAKKGARANWAATRPSQHPSANGGADKKSGVTGEMEGDSTLAAASLLTIRDLRLRDAAMVYHDLDQNLRYTLRPLNLSASELGLSAPARIDASGVLARGKHELPFTLELRFQLDQDRLRLRPLKASINKGKIEGELTIPSLRKPNYQFALSLDDLDLDPLLALAGGNGATAGNAAPARPAGRTTPTSAAAPWANLRAQGSIKAKNIRGAGLKLDRLTTQLLVRDQQLRLRQLEYAAYEGQGKGQLTLDARNRLSTRQDIQDVNVGALLKALNLSDKLAGKGRIVLDLQTRLGEGNTPLRQLNGRAGFTLRDARFKNVSLIKTTRELRQLSDVLRGKNGNIKAQTGDEDVFEELVANFTFTNGRGRNDDLLLKSARLQGTGRGEIDLVRDRIDYRLRLTEMKDGQPRDQALPIKVQCKLSEPCFRLDTDVLLEQQKKRAKKKLKKETEKKLRDELMKRLYR